MAYRELIKNFENIRAYLREFYVYGFKSRTEYDLKSARSYDNERRRIESWLGDHIRSSQTADGKNIFLSIDSRTLQHNPFYKAWKAKSFTDRDITLHFILFDILHTPAVQKSLNELLSDIDTYLRIFPEPLSFDASTVRKKLKEYIEEGLIRTEKQGRQLLYARAPTLDRAPLTDIIDFFSEAAPCGVIGSFLQDALPSHTDPFTFKHHYMTQAIDSDILARLFDAIHAKRAITATNLGRHSNRPKTIRLIPLKIYISVQSGRQHLIAFHEKANRLTSYRLDYLSNIQAAEVCSRFDALRTQLAAAEPYMWGVNCRSSLKHLEHVEFEIQIAEHEQFIVQRLEREKRGGTVTQIDARHYRYTADVFDTNEMLPWIRSYLSRIISIRFSNRTAENKWKADLDAMYQIYGISEDTI